MKISIPVIVALLTILVTMLWTGGCSSCNSESTPAGLSPESMTGRWEAMMIDGEKLPEARQHFLDFKDNSCRFHGILRKPNGEKSALHDYTRACTLEKREQGWVLVFDAEKGHFLDLIYENGILSMILPPQKTGDKPRVLTTLKKAKPGDGELPPEDGTTETEKK